MQSYKDLFEHFKNEILPSVIAEYGTDDDCAVAEAWNDWTDMLARDGELTSLELKYCPAYGETMPGDNREHVLECMGVRVEFTWKSTRPDRLMDDNPGASHWLYEITRDNQTDAIIGYFSQGSAYGNKEPDPLDLVNCLLSDYSIVTNCADFSEWCDELGYDDDSIKALRIFEACKHQADQLQRLFSADELSGLIDLMGDY